MTETDAGSDARAARRKLPIGIQTFRIIREEGYYYVDKTAYLDRLIDEGAHYFLSRPRSFGKSLLLDTLKELFEGAEPLFRGLAIHGRWDWSVRHPVVRLSFGHGNFKDPDYLAANLAAQLDDLERRTDAGSGKAAGPDRFARLLQALHERAGRRVVVLIDEYDKPILDALEAPDVARANRDFLRGLYAVVKDCNAHVRFTLLTGVSKFSKVNLFSGLNNLQDITIDSRYSALCGYTEADLDTVFAPELPGLDRNEIRRWYNGYNWLGDEKVYNPFDVLLLFDTRRFKAWWFETGTPTFLIDTLVRRGVGSLALEEMTATDALLSAFDVGAIGAEALLFQTGYLTIEAEEHFGGDALYRLGYPNHEVRQGLNESLLSRLADDPSDPVRRRVRLYQLLRADDLGGLEEMLKAFFAGIPYQWHVRNDIADYEGYYASVFYALFAASGLDVAVEDSTSRGRVDLTVRLDGRVYLFEFKVVDSTPEDAPARPTAALAQLRERGYADKHRAAGRPVRLIAVEFSKQTRNVAAFEAAPA